ncbi:MAG TPA: hypothetical protein VH186_36040 [Chloroflexia bacterium]|nr:hypothetical protein [Chloroflexia bacterium]
MQNTPLKPAFPDSSPMFTGEQVYFSGRRVTGQALDENAQQVTFPASFSSDEKAVGGTGIERQVDCAPFVSDQGCSHIYARFG